MSPTPRQPFADAQAALPFVVEQGRNMEARVYQKRYPTLNYAQIVPVVTEGAEWAIGTMFQTLDVTGKAKFISGAANDLPFASAVRDLKTHDFAMVGAGWEWNMEEVNQAALYGIALDASKSSGASLSVEQLLYDIAMVGSTEKNWKGFTNQSGVLTSDAAATGTGSSRFWSAKDVDDISDDVNTALGLIRENSNEVEWGDTIAIPPSAFRLIATRRIGAGDGMLTVLEYIRRNNVYTAETGQQLSIIPVRDLETASGDGGGRMVAYRRDVDVLRFHLPMPRRVIGVHQKTLMSFEDGIIARTGGVEVRLPGAMVYVDEITAVPS